MIKQFSKNNPNHNNIILFFFFPIKLNKFQYFKKKIYIIMNIKILYKSKYLKSIFYYQS